MRTSCRACNLSSALLLLIATLLADCSQQPRKPEPPPVVVKCQPPLIDPGLMVPPEHQAIDRLLMTLQLPPVRLGPVSSDSTLSSGK